MTQILLQLSELIRYDHVNYLAVQKISAAITLSYSCLFTHSLNPLILFQKGP